MIFHCPECNAGHSVPVSMIPNGGLDMDCRRCGEAFTIETPADSVDAVDAVVAVDSGDVVEAESEEQQEKTNVGPAPVLSPEETRVGVANPLDLESERPLIGPGGIEYSSGEEDEGPDTDSTTEALYKAGHVPLSPDEQGLDPELDDTIQFDKLEDLPPSPSPSVTEPGEVEIESEVADEEISDADSGSDLEVRALHGTDTSPSVYERVAAGIPVPEDQRSRSASVLVPMSDRRSPVLEQAAVLLNRAPLALKVGLIVFPVTLGVMLVVNSMRGESSVAQTPIEIPIAVEDRRPAPTPPPKDDDLPPGDPAEAGDVEPDPAPAPKLEPARPPPPPAAPAIEDDPAPAGFAYVQIEDARLRTRPTEKAGMAGRVAIGGMVKVYEDLGEWTLVASLPDGPAGFLSKKLLGGRKPVSLLARSQAFERCSPEEDYSVDDCLFTAKEQEQPCLDRCGAVNAGDTERLRCVEVCNAAFESCTKSCRTEPAKIVKTKQRRRR